MTGNALDTPDFEKKVVELDELITEFVRELSEVRDDNKALLSDVQRLEDSVSTLRKECSRETEERAANKVAEENIRKGDLASPASSPPPPLLSHHPSSGGPSCKGDA